MKLVAGRARRLHAPAIAIAIAGANAGGSNEAQRSTIGERVVGLHRKAAVDDVPFRRLLSARR